MHFGCASCNFITALTATRPKFTPARVIYYIYKFIFLPYGLNETSFAAFVFSCCVEKIPYRGYFSGGKIFVDARICNDSYKKIVVGSSLNHTPCARVEQWPLVSEWKLWY